MVNQYSITVSDQSEAIIQYLKKEHSLMPSRVISAAIETIGGQALINIHQLKYDPQSIDSDYEDMKRIKRQRKQEQELERFRAFEKRDKRRRQSMEERE